jgi:hypothetical protein
MCHVRLPHPAVNRYPRAAIDLVALSCRDPQAGREAVTRFRAHSFDVRRAALGREP